MKRIVFIAVIFAVFILFCGCESKAERELREEACSFVAVMSGQTEKLAAAASEVPENADQLSDFADGVIAVCADAKKKIGSSWTGSEVKAVSEKADEYISALTDYMAHMKKIGECKTGAELDSELSHIENSVSDLKKKASEYNMLLFKLNEKYSVNVSKAYLPDDTLNSAVTKK